MSQQTSIFRGFRFKLEPTSAQAALLRQFSGVCRLVYNLGLEQREHWYRNYKKQTGFSISFPSQCLELTKLRADFDWIRAVTATCQEQALRDLDRAFSAFFKGNARYPTPRRKGVNDGFRFKGREISTRVCNWKWSAVRLPKIGWVRFRNTRQLRGKLLSATITHDALGWHVSFLQEIQQDLPSPLPMSVGIDRGVAITLALSTGECMTVPNNLNFVDRRHRAAQRILARRKKGSNRRRRQLQRCARFSAKRARIRKDWHHKAALGIAQRFGHVVMEDLKTKSMTASAKGTVESPGVNVRQKASLNRAILNAGWFQFETILAYKLEEHGGYLHKVPARYTSQTCSVCGVVDARSRESQAVFRCVDCGHSENADINAAKNIERRWNTPLLDVEGLHFEPREASIKDSAIESEIFVLQSEENVNTASRELLP